MPKSISRWILGLIVAVLVIGGYYAWSRYQGSGLPPGIASGNGRIEATEIDISTKTAGRIKEIHVNEGDFVQAGDILAQMDTTQLIADRSQAQATLQQAVI